MLNIQDLKEIHSLLVRDFIETPLQPSEASTVVKLQTKVSELITNMLKQQEENERKAVEKKKADIIKAIKEKEKANAKAAKEKAKEKESKKK